MLPGQFSDLYLPFHMDLDVLLDRILRETMALMRVDFLQNIPEHFWGMFKINLNYNIVCSVVILPLTKNGIQQYCYSIDNYVESASSVVLKCIPTQWNSSLTLKIEGFLKKIQVFKTKMNAIQFQTAGVCYKLANRKKRVASRIFKEFLCDFLIKICPIINCIRIRNNCEFYENT